MVTTGGRVLFKGSFSTSFWRFGGPGWKWGECARKGFDGVTEPELHPWGERQESALWMVLHLHVDAMTGAFVCGRTLHKYVNVIFK